MSRSRILAVALLIALAPVSLMAQTPSPPPAPAAAAAPPPVPTPSLNLSTAKAGAYNIDKNHASIIFHINHLGFSMYAGRFNSFEGMVTLNPAEPEKSTLDVTVDIPSIDTHNAKLEEELRGSDWFNATKYPTATFHATKITKTGSDTASIEGNFSMMGQTHPLTLNVKFYGYGDHPITKQPVMGVSATGTLKRSQWGFTKGLPMVGDDVELTISAEFDYVGAVAPPTAPAPPKP